jgi:hypothetical protein
MTGAGGAAWAGFVSFAGLVSVAFVSVDWFSVCSVLASRTDFTNEFDVCAPAMAADACDVVTPHSTATKAAAISAVLRIIFPP